MVGVLLVYGSLSWTALFIPLLFLPYAVLLVGIGWFLAALGVYIRDISQMSSVFATILLFVSPVFYDITTLSESVQYAIYVNPITVMVTELRYVLIEGVAPSIIPLIIYSMVSCLVAFGGYFFFRRARRGFADIV